MESYDNINKMLEQLVVTDNQNIQTNNQNINQNINQNQTNNQINPILNQNYDEKNIVKVKPEQTYTGFSRDMKLFSDQKMMHRNLNLESDPSRKLVNDIDKKGVMNERLQNYEPMPNNSPYLTQKKAQNPHALNFHLDNFKNQDDNEALNLKLNQRQSMPTTKQYTLNKLDKLPIHESLPQSSQNSFIYKNQN
jgi:hypothetical protein